MKNNLIPVADITQADESIDEIMAKAKAQAHENIDNEGSFVLVSVGPEGSKVVAGCDDVDVMQAALALASMVGAASVGAALNDMPPPIASAVALTQGLSQLNQFARQVASDAGAHPHGQNESKH